MASTGDEMQSSVGPAATEAPPPPPATDEPVELASFAVKSYRYLRLSIVVVVAALMVSVLIERSHVGCWQGSISAYFYTPVHTMFLGALIAIGVCLLAIKGSTDAEDVLLNIAGVLAPIVAFVPTSMPDPNCSSVPWTGGGTEAAIDNNLVAFAIGGAIALAIAYGVSRAKGNVEGIPTVDHRTKLGLAFMALLLIAGAVWYFGWRGSFLAHAHGGAAIAMFVFIGGAMLLNARSAPKPYNQWYAATLAAMVVAALAVLIGKLVHREWDHAVLWLEIFELLPFVVYWTVQTIEHWNGGVPTGEDRDERAAEAQLMASAA
jgi:hypothetical protein